MKQTHVVAATVLAAVVVGLGLLVAMRRPAPPTGMAEPSQSPPPTPGPATAPDSLVVVPGLPTEEEMKEIRHVPSGARLGTTIENRLLAGRRLREGNRRIVGVRALTNKAVHGELLNPQWSPDGLQVLASRPGYDGLYVIDVRTGAMRRISDLKGFGARWTPEGNIEARDADGGIVVLAPDGTLLASGPAANDSPVVVENNAILVRTPEGATLPITSRDDQYFAPVVSPDGKWVVFQGLTTGLHLAPTDGSAPPTAIGPGNNPAWMPDGSGLVFDVTTDDGHVLTEGDLALVDTELTEVSHLTKGDSLITQRPSISPGGDVAFEADGTVYVGDLQ